MLSQIQERSDLFRSRAIASALSAYLLSVFSVAYAQGDIEITGTLTDTELRASVPADVDHYYVGFAGLRPEVAAMAPFGMILGAAPSVELTWPIPPNAPERQFFRMGKVSILTPLDLDADGISDVAELQHGGLDPLLADTDGDGYWDGIETQNGGDPVDAGSIPTVPFGRFDTPTTFAVEGASVINVTVTFSSAVNATVPISVAAMTTATPDADYRLTETSVAVAGTQAQFSIELLEDSTFEDVELIVLDLLPDAPGSYAVAGGTRHLVHLEDNDRYWSGRLDSSLGSLGFRLKVTQSAAGVTAALASTENTNDPFFGGPATGTIPEGEWALNSLVFDDTTFSGETVPIPMGKGSLITKSNLNRVISLQATNLSTQAPSDRTIIRGRMTDALKAEDRSQAYLDQQTSGSFTMVRNPAFLPEPNVEVKTNP